MNPVKMLSSELFPAPLGPIIAVNSPARNSPETPFKMVFFTVQIKLKEIRNEIPFLILNTNLDTSGDGRHFFFTNLLFSIYIYIGSKQSIRSKTCLSKYFTIDLQI